MIWRLSDMLTLVINLCKLSDRKWIQQQAFNNYLRGYALCRWPLTMIIVLRLWIFGIFVNGS